LHVQCSTVVLFNQIKQNYSAAQSPYVNVMSTYVDALDAQAVRWRPLPFIRQSYKRWRLYIDIWYV